MKTAVNKPLDESIESWVDHIIERTKDDEPKDPEACHKFFLKCPQLYPN